MNTDECLICYDKNNLYLTKCHHNYCKECFQKWKRSCILSRLDVTCPYCRIKLENFYKKNKTLDLASFYKDVEEDATQSRLGTLILKVLNVLNLKPFSF